MPTEAEIRDIVEAPAGPTAVKAGRTVGLSPKLKGPLVLVVASLSSFATTAIESGRVSEAALSALVASVLSAITVYIGGPGTVEPDAR